MDKVRLLRDFTDEPGDIEDPWYSGNFDRVGNQIRTGCEGLLRWIIEELGLYPRTNQGIVGRS